MPDWKPSASLSNLRKRAELNQKVRSFFSERNVLEVETPLLSEAASTDLHLESFQTTSHHYLQTSPEFFMKRLIASGVGDCYQICKAFRVEEKSSRHNPEFSILEWYRSGLDDTQLISEVADFIASLISFESIEIRSYQEWFENILDINPHSASIKDLVDACYKQGAASCDTWSRDELLDFLISIAIEPVLPRQSLCFITHYPASQAALSRKELNVNGYSVARRFEAYLGGLELANGYWELTDAEEQEARFKEDLAMRQAAGKELVPYDQKLIAALEAGAPNMSGVALGLDRLYMLALNTNKISEVISFSD